MIEISDNIFQLSSWPRNSINAYLVGDVLFDAGTRPMTKRILQELSGRSLSLHVLTHVHADHNGASKAVRETFGIPFGVASKIWKPWRPARWMLRYHAMSLRDFSYASGSAHPTK
jgi:glyoxylase-like metal-dependent hydrolase (beta-lactamase superfamily II)